MGRAKTARKKVGRRTQLRLLGGNTAGGRYRLASSSFFRQQHAPSCLLSATFRYSPLPKNTWATKKNLSTSSAASETSASLHHGGTAAHGLRLAFTRSFHVPPPPKPAIPSNRLPILATRPHSESSAPPPEPKSRTKSKSFSQSASAAPPPPPSPPAPSLRTSLRSSPLSGRRRLVA